MKIGIFGGSFNPPHIMHKKIGINLINEGYLDKVIYVPTGDFYKKPDLLPSEIRYDMVKIMIGKNKNLDISDFEFSKPTYTYQTLAHFKEKYPKDEVYFICGSDLFNELETWKEHQTLLNDYKFMIIKRNSDVIEEMKQKYQNYHANFVFANIDFHTVSSTEIRNKIKEGKKNIEEVEDEVLKYIEKRDLYRKE